MKESILSNSTLEYLWKHRLHTCLVCDEKKIEKKFKPI